MNPEELEEERRLCYVGMTRAMNTLILTRAHYRRRYGNDAPEMSIPSRFLEEVPNQLIENLGGRSPAWSTPAYSVSGLWRRRRPAHSSEFADHALQLRRRKPGSPARPHRPWRQQPHSVPGQSHRLQALCRFLDDGKNQASGHKQRSRSSLSRPGISAKE